LVADRLNAEKAEKLYYLGPYLTQINAAYEKAKGPLDLNYTKDLDTVVEKVFNLPTGSYADFRASRVSKLPKTPIASCLGTYTDEGCLICSIHHVGYFSCCLVSVIY
jgi:hypothetical protein